MDNLNAEDFKIPTGSSWMDINLTGSQSIIEEIRPMNNVINAAGDLVGNLMFDYTVPAGMVVDQTRSGLYLKYKITDDGSTQLTDANATWLSPNFCGALFNRISHDINGINVSNSDNPVQDDMVVKRLTNSYAYNSTVHSSCAFIDNDLELLNLNSSDTPVIGWTFEDGDSFWKPDCLGSFSSVKFFPENTRHTLRFDLNEQARYKKSIFQAAADKTLNTNYQIDFTDIYFMVYYVKININVPKGSVIPIRNIQSQSQLLSAGTQNEINFNVNPKTYKLVGAIQHTNVETDNTYAGSRLLALSTETDKIIATQLSYAGQNFPHQRYQTLSSGSVSNQRTLIYKDYVYQSGLNEDMGGCETMKQWSYFGALSPFQVVKDASDNSTIVNVSITASSALTVSINNYFLFNFFDSSYVLT